jgi:transcription initiation factor TFIIE subunit alpha
MQPRNRPLNYSVLLSALASSLNLCSWCHSLKDDDLAGRMGLQAKELNKLMAVLMTDRLVQAWVYLFHEVFFTLTFTPCKMPLSHRQNELKEGAQRSVLKQYYYIDYQHFCNVVKWRVAEMRRRIDTNLRNVCSS